MSPAEGLDAALERFGVEACSIEPIGTGSVNEHWLVTTELGRVVLRRYRAARSTAAIAWEHELLRYAGDRGWPVAEPLLTNSGATVVAAGGRTWSLFPFLEGEPAPYDASAAKHLKGRLLARFHEDMAGFPRSEQCPGAGREWELDVFAQAAGHLSFNAILDSFARDHYDLAWRVRREKYRNLRELARLGYGELPPVVIHRDFHHDNLLFHDGELSGLLDFDLARWDAAACDVAASLSLECLDAPDYDGINLEMARLFLEGYLSRRSLSLEERRLIPPLIRACFLSLAMFRMTQWSETGDDRAVASIARTVERRFPALIERWAALSRLCETVGVD